MGGGFCGEWLDVVLICPVAKLRRRQRPCARRRKSCRGGKEVPNSKNHQRIHQHSGLPWGGGGVRVDTRKALVCPPPPTHRPRAVAPLVVATLSVTSHGCHCDVSAGSSAPAASHLATCPASRGGRSFGADAVEKGCGFAAEVAVGFCIRAIAHVDWVSTSHPQQGRRIDGQFFLSDPKIHQSYAGSS